MVAAGWPWRIALAGLLASEVTIAAQKPLSPKSARNPLDDTFATLVNKTLDDCKVPGLAIAVIDDEEIFAEVSSIVAVKLHMLS